MSETCKHLYRRMSPLMSHEVEANPYLLVEDTVVVDGTAYRSYGITAAVSRITYRDISTDRQAVEALVERCNELRPDPIHLKDIVEDFLLSV